MVLYNVYHVLYQEPAVESWQMYRELEALAKQLVASGRLRIDAYEYSNFLRFSRPNENINVVFSHREIIDPLLAARTKKIIHAGLSYMFSGEKLEQETDASFARLEKQAALRSAITEEEELKIARLVVQATHPAVILLALVEGTEIFVSYAHVVGDMMDIQSWKQVGTSGGLQSTDGRNSAVFISCNGNPLVSSEFNVEEPVEMGDGYPAKARLLVIGAQELGHYADIIRDKKGRKVARHSANIACTKATEEAHHARQYDLRFAHSVLYQADILGIGKVMELERHLRFFKKQKRKGRIVYTTQRKYNSLLKKFIKQCRKHGLAFFSQIKDRPYPATYFYTMVQDMAFNLAPKADAYERSDPVEEDAIACVEALARVPQQEVKWGADMTSILMPMLHAFYYKNVIPACIQSYETLSGESFLMTKLTRQAIPLKVRWQKLKDKIFFWKKKKESK